MNGLRPGTYTVTATDRTTECVSVQSYVVPDESINPIPLSFQSRPMTRCVEPFDGVIIADVAEKRDGYERSDYIFRWVVGTGVPLPDRCLLMHDEYTWLWFGVWGLYVEGVGPC